MPSETPTLRPVTDDDRDLLYRIYASTRQEELNLTNWDEAQRETFLQMQFAAQDADYRRNYNIAGFQIIMLGDQPAGRLYIDRTDNTIHVVDIALLPESRNSGIGTLFFQTLQAEAEHAGKILTIHVEKFNPALRLYERLGFQVAGDRGLYWYMEWKPPASC